MCVIYAYGDDVTDWGTWDTRAQPIALSLSDGNDMLAERVKDCLTVGDDYEYDPVLPEDQRRVFMLRTDQDVYAYTAGDTMYIQSVKLS